MTQRLEQSRLLALIKQAQLEVPSEMTAHIRREVTDARNAVYTFFRHLQEQVQCQITESEQDMRFADRFFFRESANSLALLRNMVSALNRLSESVQALSTFDMRRGIGQTADDFMRRQTLFLI